MPMLEKVLNKFFPLWQVKNILQFYILNSVFNMWFVAGVWVFIWGIFMTKTQIGISDSITFTLGLLVELPSGVFADTIGRKKAILIGSILLTLGNFLIAFSSSFMSITVWYLVWTIGYAFQSGATEALAYDSLKREGLEKEWHRVISSATVIGKATSLIATAVGGFLFTMWFRLPYLVFAISGLIGVIAAIYLTEIQVKRIKNWSFEQYFFQIRDGMATLIRKKILPFSLIGLSIMGIGYMYNWGILRPLTAERIGFGPQSYSLLLAATSLIGIFAVSFLPKISAKMKVNQLLFLVGVAYAVTFFAIGLPVNWLLGGVFFISLSVLLMYMEIFFSQFINAHTKEEHRATTLSTVSLFTKLPYVLLALVIGKLADSDLLVQYTLAVGLIAILIWGVSLLLFKKSQTSS